MECICLQNVSKKYNGKIVLNNLNKNIQVFITTTDLNNIKPSMVKKSKVIELSREGERNE